MNYWYQQSLLIAPDCPCPLPVQHFWHPSVVSNPLHPHPDPAGKRSGQHHCLLPLVCCCLHHLLLLCFATLRLQPVIGWLAGIGRSGRSSSRLINHHHSDQRTAETETRVFACKTAILGFPPPLGSFSGSLGQSGWCVYCQMLLLLQMLPSCCWWPRAQRERMRGKQQEEQRSVW